MCVRNPNKIKPGETRQRSFGGKLFAQFLLPSKLIVILYILLIIPTDAFSQGYSVFNIQTLIKEEKLKYNLTRNDIKLLLPLIKRENYEILNIYTRFGDSEIGYSEILWDFIILRRCEFETRIKGKLTKRQEAALRSVRTEMEEQILNLLVGDFINYLGDYLELDHFQFDRIGYLLYQEYKRKHQAVIRKLSNITLLQNEFERINVESKSEFGKILSPGQLRLYLTLSAKDEFIAE